MSETVATRAKYVTVAVGFDRHTLPLTQYAAQLCEKLGKDLCLLHVVEPWLDKPHSIPQGQNDPLWNVNQAVEANACELAARKLDELAAEVSPRVKVVKHVARGKTIPVLCQEAFNLGSMLILVGADIDNLKYLPKGLSTALSLMISSPVPVIVLDSQHIKTGEESSPTFLVADDLTEQSEAALEFAFDLAIGYGKAKLHHLHVNGMTFDALRSGLLTAAATTHSPVNNQTTAEMVFDSLIKGLEEAMSKRCDSEREYLENGGGSYEAQVVTGIVSKKVTEEATRLGPKMLIFGRHRSYHRHPFFIGRLPFRAMLASHVPVVIVPDDGRP